MTLAVSVMTMMNGAHQKPMLLCQLKSRALPRSRRSGTVTARTARRLHARGHQRNSPLIPSPRNARLQTPVTGRPRSREPSQRCQSSTTCRTSWVREPGPSTAPVKGCMNRVASRPKPTRTVAWGSDRSTIVLARSPPRASWAAATSVVRLTREALDVGGGTVRRLRSARSTSWGSKASSTPVPAMIRITVPAVRPVSR